MSSSDTQGGAHPARPTAALGRRSLLAGLTGLGTLALAGCGFTPAYGPQGSGGKLQHRVTLDAPGSREYFFFNRRITERLGTPEAPRYRLSYSIAINTIEQAITPQDVTTRYSVRGTATYRLHDIGTDAVLLTGSVASFTSFSATGPDVATSAASLDAYERLVRILADQTVTRLIAQSGSLPE